jgi:hypothetical protein
LGNLGGSEGEEGRAGELKFEQSRAVTMVAVGGGRMHGREHEVVHEVYVRGGEQNGIGRDAREALSSRTEAHHGRSSWVPTGVAAAGEGGGQEHSAALVGWCMVQGRERGSRTSPRWSHRSEGSGELERCSGMLCRGKRRAREEGPDRVTCGGRRGGLGGHDPGAQGRREASKWACYSAGEHCSML